MIYATNIPYFSPLPAELGFHVDAESTSVPRPPYSYDYVSWFWPMWLKRKSAGNFCKAFPLLKEKCLWQVLSSPYFLYLLLLLFFVFGHCYLRALSLELEQVIRGGMSTCSDGRSEKCETPGSLMTLLGSHTNPFPLILDFFFLKLKYVYATFNGLYLLLAAQTILTGKSTWTWNVHGDESPCLFPSHTNWSDKRFMAGVWSREREPEVF